MIQPPVITTITTSERNKALACLTSAFIADPLFRWAYPMADLYLESFPKLIDAWCGVGIGNGTAFCSENFGGASIWLAPSRLTNDEAAATVVESTVPKDRLENFADLLKEMDKYHPHDEPLWYLPVIGVDPTYQGRGIGAALLKHALRLCDDQGTPAYLESSNPANISLYERHGFTVIGKIEIGSAPPVHPMLREKQA
jgi:GNAT superfamily N-acetyltransferase